MPSGEYGPDIIEQIIDGLEQGRSLVTICRGEDMPSRRTVYRWADGDDEIANRLREARELGYLYRAESAVVAAKTAKDPLAGRLAFDAERWYLGKLSNAFRDKPIAVGAFLGVGGDDAFAAVQDALDRAASGLASSGHSTKPVVIEGKARPSNAAGRLADMAGDGGTRVGEDPDGC